MTSTATSSFGAAGAADSEAAPHPRKPRDRPPVDPSRRTISRYETPSATPACTCAHSNALRTSHLSLDVVIGAELETEADAISGAANGVFASRSRCSLGAGCCQRRWRLSHPSESRGYPVRVDSVRLRDVA
jgi:hypothetical protein